MQFIEKFHEVKEATKLAGSKLQSNSSSVTPATSANVSPITSRSGMTSGDQDLIDPPNSSMMNSNMSASTNQNSNANMTATQNNVSSVSSSPLPGGGCQIKDEEFKNAIYYKSQSISQQSTESPQHQGKVPQHSAQGGQSAEMQLKYENDRLKLALAQSSANAKKWEVSKFFIIQIKN